MIKGIYHSAAGMIARQRQLDVIANNLANVDTVGFKAEKVVFRASLTASLGSPPAAQGEKLVTAERGISTIPSFGSLHETGNPLDVAIEGNGYFMIETDSGIAYTRDGRFQLNPDGELVTLNGDRVLAEGGTVQIPEGSLRINPEGEIVLKNDDNQMEQIIDRLRVVTFENYEDLRPLRNGLFATDQQPLNIEEPSIKPGYLEDSTVNPIEQMVEMIQANRIYEASSKAIQAQDSTLGKAVNEVGKA